MSSCNFLGKAMRYLPDKRLSSFRRLPYLREAEGIICTGKARKESCNKLWVIKAFVPKRSHVVNTNNREAGALYHE